MYWPTPEILGIYRPSTWRDGNFVEGFFNFFQKFLTKAGSSCLVIRSCIVEFLLGRQVRFSMGMRWCCGC